MKTKRIQTYYLRTWYIWEHVCLCVCVGGWIAECVCAWNERLYFSDITKMKSHRQRNLTISLSTAFLCFIFYLFTYSVYVAVSELWADCPAWKETDSCLESAVKLRRVPSCTQQCEMMRKGKLTEMLWEVVWRALLSIWISIPFKCLSKPWQCDGEPWNWS